MSARLKKNKNRTRQRNDSGNLHNISKWLIPKRNQLKKWYRFRFLKCLLDGPPNGLITKQLAAQIPCHRETVCNTAKDLIRDGRITEKKDGKLGTYQLSPEVTYKDPIPMAQIFRAQVRRDIIHNTALDRSIPVSVEPRFWHELERNFMGKFNGKQIHFISDGSAEEGFTIFQQRCNFCRHSQDIFLPSMSEDQRSLIEFALKIGISDIYSMLEAVRPLPNNNRKNMTNIKCHKQNSILPGAKKRRTELWVNNATIRPLDKLQEFIKLPIVKRGLAKPKYLEEYYRLNITQGFPGKNEKKEYREKIRKEFRKVIRELLTKQRFIYPDDPRYSPYEMDDASFKKLTETLSNTWSGVYETIESLKEEASKTADDIDASMPQTSDTESALLKILQILVNANANKDRKERHPERENIPFILAKIHSLLMTLKINEPENLDKALQILEKSEIRLKLPFPFPKIQTRKENRKYLEGEISRSESK